MSGRCLVPPSVLRSVLFDGTGSFCPSWNMPLNHFVSHIFFHMRVCSWIYVYDCRALVNLTLKYIFYVWPRAIFRYIFSPLLHFIKEYYQFSTPLGGLFPKAYPESQSFFFLVFFSFCFWTVSWQLEGRQNWAENTRPKESKLRSRFVMFSVFTYQRRGCLLLISAKLQTTASHLLLGLWAVSTAKVKCRTGFYLRA